MRSPLSKGTIIPLNGKEYHIDGVIGEGASCIVYNVSTTMSGITYRYRLKECYPYNALCQRNGVGISWMDEEQKKTAFDRFKKAASTIATLRSDETVGNNITEAELAENNGTCYCIMSVNHAQTYNQDQSQDLHCILKTILKLTRIVGRLHDQGYLHLDIKPDNFLVNYDPDPNLWLFDVDSLIPMGELQSGATTCYSYSKEWAAPELAQGKLNKVCPATDIYSIGAILFNKTMGRPASNEDMGLFADWNFDSEIFESINPKVYRYLREIFKRTLSASVKRRYQSAAELIDTLISASEAAAAKNYIVTPDLQIPSHFIGREQEINEIHKSFQNSNKAVFLHGIGGIGKSSLAIAYAISHKKDYDNILFCRYKTSLEDILIDLVDEIQNFEGDTKEGLRQLKRLLDKDTLLIVDNFNVATDKDPYLHQFLKLNAKLLFTSRTDFRNQLLQNSIQLEVSTLPYNQLESLFSSISDIQVNTADKRQCLSKLLKAIDYHTYITELLARQIVSSGWSLDALTRKIEDGLNGLAAAEKVPTTKDDRSSKQTIPEGLRVLFNLAALDEHSKQVLRNMYLLDQFTAVNKDTYKLFCASKWYDSETRDEDGRLTWYHFYPYISESSPDIDVINELCELGWVQNWYTLYSLHPLVAELIQYDLCPCQENCTQFYAYMNAVLLSYMHSSTDDEADEREKRDQFELMLDFLTHVDFADQTNRKMAFEFLDYTVDLEDEWIREPECEMIADKLLAFTAKAKDNLQERFRVYLLLFRMHRYTKKAKDNEDVWSEFVFADYDNISRTLDMLPSEEKQKFEKVLYTEIQYMLRMYNPALPNQFIHYAYTTWPEMFDDWDAARKDVYGLPVSEEEWEEFALEVKSFGGQRVETTAEEVHKKQEEDAAAEARENWINEMYQKFRNSENKLLFAKKLIDDYNLEVYEVAALLLEFCERIFFYLSRNQNHNSEQILSFVKNMNWHEIEEIMDYAEDIQKSAQWKKSYDGYELYEDVFYAYSETNEPYRHSICDTQLWRAMLDVIYGNWDGLDEKIAKGIPFKYADYPHEWYMLPEWEIASVCWNLGKCRNIVPRLLNWLSEYEDSSFDERQHISVFENIVIYSQKAAEEISDDPMQVETFRKISNDFTDRINSITGKSYTLKRDLDKK